MEITAINAFLLFGIIQGIVLVFVVLRQKARTTLSYRLFAIVILILTLATMGMFVQDSVDITWFSFSQELLLTYFPFHLIIPLGPAIYLYVKSMVIQNYKLDAKEKLHMLTFLPEVLPFLASIVIIVSYNLNLLSEIDLIAVPSRLYEYINYMEHARLPLVLIYLHFSWRLLTSKKQTLDYNTYKWGKALLSGFSIVSLVWTFLFIYDWLPWRYAPLDSLEYLPVYYPIVALIYFLSVRFMFQNTPWRTITHQVDNLESKALELEQLVSTEELYRNPNLKLEHLSERAGIPEKTISFVLNHHFKKGFNDFINYYRVQEALTEMNSDNLKFKTLEGIGYEVGFSSRSTFYRAFKKITGKQPSAYIKD